MKTKELIELLQREDPSGELPVCVDGVDVYTGYSVPAYYDGRLQQLIKDETKQNCYNITGIRFLKEGSKVVLRTMSLDDVLWEDPDAVVTYDYDPSEKEIQEVEDLRESIKRELEEIDREMRD